MRRMRWATYLWPGLPQLIARGSWVALGVAVMSAVLLNVALLSTFAWSELLVGPLRIAIWLFTIGAWVVSAGWSLAKRLRPGGPPEDPGRDTLEAAIERYLKGEWFETEQILMNLLRRNEDDVEAELMLATLLRHRGRYDEAAKRLERLEAADNAWRWEWEICRERQLLAQGASEPHEESRETDADALRAA